MTEAYEKRLIEINKYISASQGEIKKQWMSYLRGFIEALELVASPESKGGSK